jgi:hypothetical protein
MARQYVRRLGPRGHSHLPRVLLVFALLAIVLLAGARCGSGPTGPSQVLPPNNTFTAAPAPVAPSDGASVDQPRPTLRVTNARGAGTTARTYTFQVAGDASFAPLVLEKSGVPEGSDGTTAYQVEQDLPIDRDYFWRVRASEGSQTSAWSSIARFRAVSLPNTAPRIVSLTASSGRAEVDGTIQLTAVVQDDETPVDQLTFEWSAPAGSFSGSGTQVTWRAPTGVSTPVAYDLTLTVTEHRGGDTQVSANRRVQVNDSQKEVSDLAKGFLDDFSDSSKSASYCVRNFSDNCRNGRDEEYGQISANRDVWQILGSDIGKPSVSLNSRRDFANISVPCGWTSKRRADGVVQSGHGNCTLTAVYDQPNWHLCESHYTATGLQPSQAPRSMFP